MRTYSDKFLNHSKKLKSAVVGFEFEFYLKDLSYYKTLEMLNQEFSPIKVWGFRQYHSDFEPDATNFKIEPDLSGGANMVELVTGPMGFYDAKYFLIKIINFIQKHGYTNDKSSIHFNISFNELDLNDLNTLKLILNLDEEEIYRTYPSRKANVYAKSIKKIIPYKEYDFFNIPITVVKNNLRLPNDKYYGINFLHINNNKKSQRLEFRYIGGKDYETNLGQLIYFLEKFIILTHDCISQDFDTEDADKLEDYLDENIKTYNNFSHYDNFITNFPSVQIQIDQDYSYEVVSAYYQKVYPKIFTIIDSCEALQDCMINYVTQTQTFEVVDATVKTTQTMKDVDFVNSKLEGLFDNCLFLGCEIKNSQCLRSKLIQTDCEESKVLSSKVEQSQLKNCYFVGGYLNGDMIGGVYRSGKLGPYATMDVDVKIVRDNDNFFDTKYEDETKGDKKGVITGYGKK
ncbi:MAG: hypothetical protein EBU90_11890 [Proteobacteria bacterium]|nr:hypothetical protein [Pseudomonadota bacterium]NBP15363.1 hypothetical protein [bacterium]